MADEETTTTTTTMESAVLPSLRNRGASISVSEANGIEFEGPYLVGQDITLLVSTLTTLTMTATTTRTSSSVDTQDTSTEEISLIKKLRLVDLRFELFDPLILEALNDLLSSRVWDRIVVVYCRGGIPIQVVGQCRRLELYGGGPNWDVVTAATATTIPTTTTTTTPTIWQALGRALDNPDSLLRFLRIRSRFQHDMLAAWITGLGTSHCPLEELHFTSEFVDDDCMSILTWGLQHNHHLKRLTFYSCEFHSESGLERLVSEGLVYHPTLRALELQDNNCFAMDAIVSLIQTTKTLQVLNLYYPPPPTVFHHHHHHHNNNNNTAQGVVPRIDTESLALALQANTSLKHLALPSNALNDEAATWLAKALRVNRTLETLDLTGNVIENDGAIAFGEALPDMKGLKHLYLKNNQFRGKGATALALGMKDNVVLEHLTTFSKFTAGDTIQFYCHLNQAGRRILRHVDANAVPASLWPHILNRVNHHFSDTWGGDEGGEGSGGGGGVGEMSSVIYSLLVEGGHEQIFGR
jgi:Leucine Rich repeat